ncbi:suppressor of tub2 mutation [Ceratobasidium sp. 395]|nr:suppressor of tub2 mutation [Ceratobasidium sp. 395]
MPSSTGSPVSRKPLPANLPSLDQMIDNSESLLHAATIPIPDDDDDESMNLISFSTPYEKYPPTPPSTVSSSNIVGDMHEPDESLIAKAIQATSAASQLEDEVTLGKDHPSPYPPELLAKRQDQTPMNRKIMREAALWQDSPQATKTPTILDHLFDQMHENGSWVHRRTVSLRQASVDLDVDSTAASTDLRRNIDALSQGTADDTVLRHLAVICSENGHSNATESISKGQGSPELAPSSPTRTNGGGSGRPFTIQTDIWFGGKIFDKLFDALTGFLTYDKPVETLDLGLAVIWEMLRHQWDYITEHQSELWAFLIRLRYANSEQVLQGTNAIRDALTAAVEPVFGLATANGCLVSFLTDAPPSPDLEPVRVNSWAYGLIGMAKLVMRFPPDILEEEIPRIRSTLTTAICYEQSALVRGAATVAIAACQLVLRDETHLFTLLGNLPNEKKNLLTYYFNRTGSRGPAGSTVEASKVDEEIRKIDRGTTLPPRKPIA